MRRLLAILVLLGLVGVAGYAELGVGVSAYYPLLESRFDEYPRFSDYHVGGSFRYKGRLLMADATLFAKSLRGGGEDAGVWWLLDAYADAGVGFDLWILRMGVLAGVNYSRSISDFDASLVPSQFDGFGMNLRPLLELKIGPIALGGSVAIPVHISREGFGIAVSEWDERLLSMATLCLYF